MQLPADAVGVATRLAPSAAPTSRRPKVNVLVLVKLFTSVAPARAPARSWRRQGGFFRVSAAPLPKKLLSTAPTDKKIGRTACAAAPQSITRRTRLRLPGGPDDPRSPDDGCPFGVPAARADGARQGPAEPGPEHGGDSRGRHHLQEGGPARQVSRALRHP